MHKNLKKVISSIAALALSASSFVALAATTSYPDVAESANYYKAVTELSGLNVINGYEDGTFGPEKLVTRAEITKMIVAALGPAYTDAANAAAGQNTKFTDVTASHWAAGFVTEGTTVGFIAGMGDGTFAPNSNVTFAQATTMLVRAAGYETWAKAQGYPQGYMSYGAQLEITKGVSVDNNTELNRGQVAILIDNTLDAPILKVTGYEVAYNGESVPKYTKMDGTTDDAKDKQTILTENHNAARVYGRVTETATSGSANLDADKVKFQIEKSYNWMEKSAGEKEVKTTTETVTIPATDTTAAYTTTQIKGTETETVYINGTGADKYPQVYAEGIIKKNDNDEFEFISFFPSAKVDTVALKTKDYAISQSAYTYGTEGKIEFYKDENQTSTKQYSVVAYPKVAVNGVELTTVTDADLKSYISGNTVGDITLMDVPAAGQTSTDGKYDYIAITYYKDAVVESVRESATEPKIYFEDAESPVKTMTLKLEDTDKTYSFTLNGEEIKYTDLQANDIVSIAWDVTQSFDNSKFYDVLVSRDTVTGTVDATKRNKTLTAATGSTVNDYQIAGTYYETTSLATINESSDMDGTEFAAYLDVFGRIAKIDQSESGTKKICILDAVTTESDTDYITVYTADGSKVRYQSKSGANNLTTLRAAVYNNGTNANAGKTDPTTRVFRYSVNSKNEITITTPALVPTTSGASDSYNIDSMKVGNVRINAGTPVLDATDYYDKNDTNTVNNDYDIVAGTLVDGDDYVVSGFDQNTTGDGTYRFVVITEGKAKITSYSKMAVVSDMGKESIDGETLVTINAYTAGSGAGADGEIKLVVDSSLSAVQVGTLAEGTPFYYTTNSDGYVDEIDVIVAQDPAHPEAVVGASDFVDVFATGVNAGVKYVGSNATPFNFNEVYLGTGNNKQNDKASFKFLPIVKKTTGSLAFATKAAAPTTGNFTTAFLSDVNAGQYYSYASDMTVLVCNNDNVNDKVSLGSKADIIASKFAQSSLVKGQTNYDSAATEDLNYKDLVVWSAAVNDNDSEIYYALVKLVNNYITEAYVIQPDVQ